MGLVVLDLINFPTNFVVEPSIRMEPAERSMDVMLGDAVDVACVVLEGKPEVTVTWSREVSSG